MTQIARVVVDVTGVDKPFDYSIPDHLADDLVVGSRVRVPLHRREVSGWVSSILDARHSDVEISRLLEVRKVTSVGPAPDVVELVDWAAHRWASRRRPLLVAASPDRRVPRRAAARYSSRSSGETHGPIAALIRTGGGVVQCGPASRHVEVLTAAISTGPTIVVAPTIARAGQLAAESRRLGFTTAMYPQEWTAAASGVDVVVGARSAVWASVPNLSCIVVIDEHDDSLQEERSPTWHARDVAVERARRSNVPCVLVSPVPTLSARHWAGDRVVATDDANQWPTVRIVDRTVDDRWASSLVTSPLIELLRDHGKRVVCVLNVKGRARALACNACRTVARCESCGAAVNQPDEQHVMCPRCSASRPVVCSSCGSQKMRAIRVGITRLREELEAAAGRPVQEIAPSTELLNPAASVFVGTEAVLYRVDRADVVVFLDIDAELLAPRFRASEQALDLLLHGARLVANGGELVIQTAVPHHEVLTGLAAGDLSTHVTAEIGRRERLLLPPFGALAEVSGKGAADVAAQLAESLLVQVAMGNDRALVRAESWDALSEALAAVDRPKERVRIAVDPPRA
ncbi:MAG: hypothetical protein ACO3EH_02130 [Ilumatobacteraceae bacterium]